MNKFLVLLVFMHACLQVSLCSDWKNTVVKLENNVIKNTVLEPRQPVYEAQQAAKNIVKEASKQFFRIPVNHVPANIQNFNGQLPHIQQEPVVPVIPVEPSNVIQQVPFQHGHQDKPVLMTPHRPVVVNNQAHEHFPFHHDHQENHFGPHIPENPVVVEPHRPVVVVEPVIKPFPIEEPVISAFGEPIIEHTIGGSLLSKVYFKLSK